MLEDEALTYRICGCVYEVYKQLGHGFLEKVYERALLKELELQGLMAKAQVAMAVRYKSEVVGEYLADIIVENMVVLELKARPAMSKCAEAQLLNYLKAGGLRLGLLINLAYPRATIKRLVV